MKDNSTGKDKDFYSRGKQAFDSIKVIHIDGKKAPQRPWVGLTDEEVENYWDWEDFQCGVGRGDVLAMVLDIQAKLKEKNK